MKGVRTRSNVARFGADFPAARSMRQLVDMSGGVRRFTDLRAWQTCDAYKKAVYGICGQPPLANDWKLREQLVEFVRGPCAHIAEGFGRFNPPDNARFVVMARASLMESQNHLGDLVDPGYISEAEPRSRTSNPTPEPRTLNPELGTEREHELRSENPEV